MAPTTTNISEVPPASAADSVLAGEASQQLARILGDSHRQPLLCQIVSTGRSQEIIQIPFAAAQLLESVLRQMSQGDAVTVISDRAELSTRQAAKVLGVSRPFLIEQLERGLISYRQVGTHRRLQFKDLMAYKQSMERNRLDALVELSAIDQKLGLGY